ncbi:MAG TPA: S8 family serine peptidase, partial [Patescibacteria group bacterium]|nr:S8 family serine peptidase [Patescibacteria group bacterium]
MHWEKLSRSAAQQKIGSQLLYTLRQRRQGVVAFGVKALKPDLHSEPDGRFLVDLQGNVSPALLRVIKIYGGIIINSFERAGMVRALIPIELAETLAQRVDVRSVRPASRASINTAITLEGGDIAHRSAEARQFFSVDGSGVKIGVLSDSVDNLADAQAAGALPAVTILPGQAGTGSGEGTAILEIVHALAPGSPLYFATALSGEASFAQNIRALQAAGCKIIIDDVTYFDESPFQDGIIAQAVNDVSAAGVLFFSSAGNSGGVDRGTSGTWEGDFKDGGPATIGQGGRLHDFGGATYNTMLPGIGFERVDLSWSDPLGHSSNDYDLYVLDSSGNIVASSTDSQNGKSDPYEAIGVVTIGQRIVVVKYSGEDRFLHIGTGRGHLTFTTPGTTYGHNAAGASNAFCVAATRVSSTPVPFVGGAANPVETFSSDGPRRMFYNPDGTPFTEGDLSSTGGRVFQKPDLTAADGVYTSLARFSPFSGTSAAAPHAGAIAALLWSYNPLLTPAEIRSLLTGTALSTGSPGFDRNTGFGIVMAYPALAAAPQTFLKTVQLQDANQNGRLDPNECADLLITLQNSTSQSLSGIQAVLSSPTPQVYVDPAPRSFPDLQPGQTGISTIPFHISTGPGFVC